MDLVRSCYTVNMRFTDGGPLYPVRWFRCKPGAKAFSGPNCFFSHNWLVWKGADVVGEDRTVPPVWANGAGPPALNGHCSRCYDPALFAPPGMPPGLLFNNLVDAAGVPQPCLGYDSSMQVIDEGRENFWTSWGGIVFSGQATVTRGLTTVCCPTTLLPWTLHGQSLVDGSTFTLTYQPAQGYWQALYFPPASTTQYAALLRCNSVSHQFEGSLQPSSAFPVWVNANGGFACSPFLWVRTGLLKVTL